MSAIVKRDMIDILEHLLRVVDRIEKEIPKNLQDNVEGWTLEARVLSNALEELRKIKYSVMRLHWLTGYKVKKFYAELEEKLVARHHVCVTKLNA